MRKRDELVRSLGRHHRRHVRDGQHIAFGDRIGLDLAQRLGGHAYFPAGHRLTQGGGLVGHVHHLDAAVGVDVRQIAGTRDRGIEGTRRPPMVFPSFLCLLVPLFPRSLVPCCHPLSQAGAPRPLYLPPAWYSPGRIAVPWTMIPGSPTAAIASATTSFSPTELPPARITISHSRCASLVRSTSNARLSCTIP